MAKLKTSRIFMPTVIDNFISQLRTIQQVTQQARDDTSPENVMTAYTNCKLSLDKILSIESTYTLPVLKTNLESLTNEPDWSIYNVEYAQLKTDVGTYLSAVEANVSELTISSISVGQIVWTPLTAGKVTAIQGLLDSILSGFE